MKLLIADDDYQILTGLRDGINWGAVGFDTVSTATNGNEALEIFIKERPQIVITDIRMPGLDGLALSEEMKKISDSVKIIIVSGHSDFQYARQAIKLGVCDYMLKPVNIRELLSLLSRLFSEIQRECCSTSNAAENRLKQIIGSERKGFSPFMIQAAQYIENNYYRDITIQDLAAFLKKNANYFSHLFKKEFCMSFVEYLNRVRIQYAKELLMNTSMLAYEIAERVGFQDYKYFTQVYKKFEKMSPAHFRKQP